MQGLESAKISNGTAYKQIKIYDKGLQCHEVLNAPEIDRNTLRFEVKTKQFKNIRKLGIWSANNLLNLETYERLGQSLNEEFKFILILDKTADLSDLKNQEREFIIKANKEDFWVKNLHDYTLKKFIRYRKKYKEIMQSKKIKHSENLGQKISEKIAGIDEIIYHGKTGKIEGKTRKVFAEYPKYEFFTSHIGRRSFASNFYGKIPTTHILVFTGHTTEKQLLTYIGKSETEKSKLSAMAFKELGY